MELAQRLSTCKKCDKRKFDPNSGLVCSLTLRKPEFDDKCNDFVIDPKEVAKFNAKAYEAEQESKSSISTWAVIAIVLFVVRFLFRMMRD